MTKTNFVPEKFGTSLNGLFVGVRGNYIEISQSKTLKNTQRHVFKVGNYQAAMNKLFNGYELTLNSNIGFGRLSRLSIQGGVINFEVVQSDKVVFSKRYSIEDLKEAYSNLKENYYL